MTILNVLRVSKHLLEAADIANIDEGHLMLNNATRLLEKGYQLFENYESIMNGEISAKDVVPKRTSYTLENQYYRLGYFINIAIGKRRHWFKTPDGKHFVLKIYFLDEDDEEITNFTLGAYDDLQIAHDETMRFIEEIGNAHLAHDAILNSFMNRRIYLQKMIDIDFDKLIDFSPEEPELKGWL
jgi:hypothetical protein